MSFTLESLSILHDNINKGKRYTAKQVCIADVSHKLRNNSCCYSKYVYWHGAATDLRRFWGVYCSPEFA